jgi:hypothetical protein
MKQKIRLTEGDLHRIIKKCVNEATRVRLDEKIKSKKLQQIANEHGGIKHQYYKNGGGVGSGWEGYVSEMPDEYILGVGDVDLSYSRHKPFEINGISDDDMDQIYLNDGSYLYYDKRKMQNFAKDRKDARSNNNKTIDGAFAYRGKYSDKIDDKKWNYEGSMMQNFMEKVDNADKTIRFAINDIRELKGMNTAFDLDKYVQEAMSSLEKLHNLINDVKNNAVDNFVNKGNRGGHYWRSGQPNSVQKYMKARDSREFNSGGRTDTYYDVQGGGPWGHDNAHSREPLGHYEYR